MVNHVSQKAMLLPVAMFTNLNSEPDLQGIAWLVTDNYLKGLGHASLSKFHIDQQNTKLNRILQ